MALQLPIGAVWMIETLERWRFMVSLSPFDVTN